MGIVKTPRESEVGKFYRIRSYARYISSEGKAYPLSNPHVHEFIGQVKGIHPNGYNGSSVRETFELVNRVVHFIGQNDPKGGIDMNQPDLALVQEEGRIIYMEELSEGEVAGWLL